MSTHPSKTTTFTQNFSNIKKPDTNLVNLIQNQTKSYGYSWTGGVVQPYKGKTAGPTPGKPKPSGSQAQKVNQKELDARNQAVKNGADLRDGKSIQAVSDKTFNEKVLPVSQAGVGAAEVIGGSAACVTGVGCIGGAVLIANGLDNMATGGSNFNEKPTEQVPSAVLDAAGVSKETAGWVKLGTDLGAGGVVANLTKPKPKATVNSAASKAEIDAQRIENNVNVDNPSFGNSAVRDFTATPNNPVIHRAENINAGQVTDRDGLPRTGSTKGISDSQIIEMNEEWPSYYGTGYPAWKPGTTVKDRVVDQPETYRMVVSKDQYETIIDPKNPNPSKSLGGWATQEPVNSVSDMRNKLAVTEEFKPKNLDNGEPNSFYVVEFEVKSGVGVREGIAGTMYDTVTKKTLPGGVKQTNFVDKSPYTNPELFEIKEIKEIN